MVVRLVETSAAKVVVQLPPSMLESVGLMSGQSVVIKAGQRRATARVQVGGCMDERNLVVSASVLRALHLPPPLRVGLKVLPRKAVIRLGPVVAVFVGARLIGPLSHPFGNQTDYLKQLILAGRRDGAFVYAFAAGSARFQSNVIRGYTVDGSGNWHEGIFPMPDVVYDRASTHRAETLPSAQRTRRELRRKGLPYFNPGYFDKWALHRLLSKRPDVRSLLPETIRFGSRKTFEDLLAKHRSLYVKPTKGSQGDGIIVIRTQRTGQYAYHVHRRSGVMTRTVGNISELYSELDRITSGRPYIVQPDLQLAQWAGRRFDVRILMQKDESGNWQRTKTYARVAPPGRLTSNISRGGTGLPLPAVARRAFGTRWRHIASRVRRTGQRVAQAVEESLNRPVGELGLDIGIDRSGRLWLIEVNSKPFLKLQTKRGSQGLIRLSLKRPLGYATLLSKFTNGPGLGGDGDAAAGRGDASPDSEAGV